MLFQLITRTKLLLKKKILSTSTGSNPKFFFNWGKTLKNIPSKETRDRGGRAHTKESRDWGGSVHTKETRDWGGRAHTKESRDRGGSAHTKERRDQGGSAHL